MLSLRSSTVASDNELRLTYGLPPRSGPGSAAGDPSVTISLLFVPGTRQLAAAQIDLDGVDGEVDVGDIVDAHVQRNDVPGLLTAVTTRLGALMEGSS